MKPLTMAEIGEIYFVKKITGKDEIRQHLAELGFVIGERVRVVSELSGNIIVMIKCCRVALDKETALRIMV